jgi:hypothetical protein
MAGITQTFVTAIKNDAAATVATATNTQTGDALEEFSVVAPGSGNVVLPITVDVSTVISFYIVSDKDVTLTENDDGSPDLTQALTANVPYWWYNGNGTNPFTVDITSLKFTKAGAGDAVCRGAFLTT